MQAHRVTKGNRLAFSPTQPQPSRMGLPTGPVTLTIEQLEELNRKLATMRHDVNNHLSLIVAAVELLKLSPESAPRMAATLAGTPTKISEEMIKFSTEFDRILGVSRS